MSELSKGEGSTIRAKVSGSGHDINCGCLCVTGLLLELGTAAECINSAVFGSGITRGFDIFSSGPGSAVVTRSECTV